MTLISSGRKAQSAMEFMIIIAAVLFFALGFFAALQVNREGKINEKRDLFMNDAALAIRDEINLAHAASDGYSRNFDVPNSAYGLLFNVSMRENSIYVVSEDNRHALAYAASNVSGEIRTGLNVIEKINGSVYLNR